MRKITNREACPCAFCGVTIQTGEECVQSQAARRYNHKWHSNCVPQAHFSRFGSDNMNKPKTKATLHYEHMQS